MCACAFFKYIPFALLQREKLDPMMCVTKTILAPFKEHIHNLLCQMTNDPCWEEQ
jgi:hypothetical protein